ncbi:MAG: NAD(P)/FAD-dependent oxidoreductase [Anaerolineae bacterium]
MKVAIIGGGVAGLAAAFDLTRSGHAVTIFEANPRPGGLASGFKTDRWDWELERFYHHWFASDKHILRLIEEIGQQERLFFGRPVTSLFIDGETHQLDSIPSALFFPKLPLIPKLRFGLAGLYIRLSKNWRALEKYTAEEWLMRTMGDTAYRVLWQPLLEGKFGKHYREVNMAWFWARLHSRTRRLGYFEGGFQAFIDALCDQVKAQGAEVRLATPVQEIDPTPERTLTVRSQAGAERFDRVLATVSPGLLSRIAPALPASYTAALKRLNSLGAVVLVLALKHQLVEGHYWINLPKAEKLPFLALVEHTNFIDPGHYGGDHLVYLGDYLPPDHEYFQLAREELLERFLPHLRRFNPNFDRSWLRDSWLFREKYAQPVPPINHSASIPPLATPVPGLYWASMSQVYPWDRGTNYAVEIGRRAAREMVK